MRSDDDCCGPVSINGLSQQFGQSYSDGQLSNYRRDGLGQRALFLVEFLQRHGLEGKTVLDIGSGVGALHIELLLAGAERAMGVDASATNLAAARQLAEEAGVADRSEEKHGDFVELQGKIPAADIVTLDRAVCCYPAIRELLSAAGDHAREHLALTMPRRTPLMRVGIRVINAFLTVTRKRFRVYDHPPHIIDGTLQAGGFRKVIQRPAGLWEARIYEREGYARLTHVGDGVVAQEA